MGGWSHGRSSGWLPLHGPHLFNIALALGASSNFSERMATLSAFAARPERVARAWSVLRFLGANYDPLGQCFRPVVTLARGASSKFSAQTTTRSLFVACRSTGAWSVREVVGANDDPLGVLTSAWIVLEILGAKDDLCVVFGAWQHWRVEGPRNSKRERRIFGAS